MQASGHKSLPTIGFLSVVDRDEQGFFGGYLILNTRGRPIEFHCTAPVKPNKAQEILYGSSLKPYVYGEQIGQTLVSKAKEKPLFVCTDVGAVLDARQFVKTPIVLLLDQRVEYEANEIEPQNRFDIGEYKLAVAETFEKDQQVVASQWQTHADRLDLQEPFERIREAMNEAQRSARQAA